jgi:hypothetical protein
MSFYHDDPKIGQIIRLAGGQNGVMKASVEHFGFPMYEIQRLFRKDSRIVFLMNATHVFCAQVTALHNPLTFMLTVVSLD